MTYIIDLDNDDNFMTLHAMMIATALPDDDAPDYSYNDDDLDLPADDDAHLDTLDAIERALRPAFLDMINDDDARTLHANALELCPLHLCDAAICADDRIAACSHLR